VRHGRTYERFGLDVKKILDKFGLQGEDDE